MTQERNTGPTVVRVLTEDVRVSAGAFVSNAAGVQDWTVGSERPDGFAGQIVRMFITDSGVEIYIRSAFADGQGIFCRRAIPWRRVLSVEELMDEEVFAQELAAAQMAAESGEEDDGDEETEAARPAQRTGTG